MTADRWWVRIGARWMARIEAVKGIVDMVMLGMTGVSTALFAMKQYGYGQYALPLVVSVLAGTIVFTYLYTEGGVWNQKQRDSIDMSSNFATPRDKIDDSLIGVAVFSAVHGRPPREDERAVIQQAVHEQWTEFRGGVDLDHDQHFDTTDPTQDHESEHPDTKVDHVSRDGETGD